MNTVRTFVSPSEGMDMGCCSDRLAVEAAKGRFVVADGVSSSHLPGLWAGLLCLDFITEREPADRWAAGLDAERRTVLHQLWEEDCDETELNADAAGARRLRRTRSFYGHGASTLAGVTIDGRELAYCIVGDTCLWMRGADERTSCLPSGIVFTSLTDALSSDWDTHPEPVTGRKPLTKGVLVLATDALSDWIGRMEADGRDAIGMLEGLGSRDEFEDLVRRYRMESGTGHLNDDDVSAVVIRIDDPGSDSFEVTRFDPVGRLDAPLADKMENDNEN